VRQRLLAAAFGLAFGFWLAWTRMTDFDQIVGALLLERAYLWLMFATGVVTTIVGLQVLRGAGVVTLLGHEPLSWPSVMPQRRHVVGSLLFGTGWALCGACPGPIVAQVGAGRLSSLFTLAGLLAGIALADGWSRRSGQSRLASPCAGEATESLA
jgi:uncharacterized protein